MDKIAFFVRGQRATQTSDPISQRLQVTFVWRPGTASKYMYSKTVFVVSQKVPARPWARVSTWTCMCETSP